MQIHEVETRQKLDGITLQKSDDLSHCFLNRNKGTVACE